MSKNKDKISLFKITDSFECKIVLQGIEYATIKMALINHKKFNVGIF